MKSLQVRKLIAVLMVIAYIIFNGYTMLFGSPVPSEFTILAGVIVGYYFGKSTALEQPK